jgi:putative ABC transport system substrate-binding protein
MVRPPPARRRFLRAVGLSLGLSALPILVGCRRDRGGETPPAVRRVGFLSAGIPENSEPYVAVFRQALRDLGYVPEQTVIVDYRYAENVPDRLPSLAAELIGLGVDVLVAHLPAAAQAAKRATSTTPIVMINGATDPVAEGLAASLARPGGNLTGSTTVPLDFWGGKQVELLKEAVPAIARLAVLWDVAALGPVPAPDAAALPSQAMLLAQSLQAAARDAGIQLHLAAVRVAEEIESVVVAMAEAGIDGLYVFESSLTHLHRQRIAELALRHRLPSISTARAFAAAGGLIVHLPDVTSPFQRAAVYVDRVLKGAAPGELPIEAPTRFELVINLRTARALGLTIPSVVLARATEVIE